MPFAVYILQSEKDRSFYIGHTADLNDRLSRHNEGRSIYTKSRRPWRLVHQELFETRSLAMKRERELKSLHRRDLLEQLISSSG
ncbi:MAG: GIY-YIG nuclease family protein [Nitrospirota bacterium]